MTEKKGKDSDVQFSTSIKRQSAELMGCTDIVLLPPVMIKNCLPCFIQVKAVDKNEENGEALNEILKMSSNPHDENQWYKVDKSQETVYVCKIMCLLVFVVSYP